MQHKDVPSMPIKQKPTGAKTILLIPAGEQCCYEVAGPRARKVSLWGEVDEQWGECRTHPTHTRLD